MVFEWKIIDPTILCSRTLKYYEEFVAENVAENSSSTNGSVEQVVWQAPELGLVKLNTNAAVLQGGSTGFGMVVRDQEGDVMMSAGTKVLQTLTWPKLKL